MREPIQVVELVQDFCANEYGVSPCTASGSEKCFNTRFTCQDSPNYNLSSKTLRFAKANTSLPTEEYIIPSLISVSTNPTIINIANGSQNQKPLGVRASATFVFQDAPHTDRIVDPYRSNRSYEPLERSTFWAKWLARNPYYQNRVIRVLDGYVGESLSSMTSREYFIDSISGPDASGRVSIKARDVLTLADDKKAQAPAASEGELIEYEPAADTTIRITGAEATEYPAPGIVRISDELIRYTGVSTISDTEINLTECARGSDSTEASDHSSGDRVQLCLEYSAENCADVARDLLNNYTTIDSSYIDDAEWDAERDQWLGQFDVTTIISEPTGVTTLLGELTEQCLFYIWWDEREQKIRMKAVRPVTEDPVRLNDTNNIIANSTNIMQESKERISQVWVFWGQDVPTKTLTDEQNYKRLRIGADLEREEPELYGEQIIRKIFSRWLVSNGQAVTLSSRMLARYRDNPQYMTLQVDAKDRGTWTGDVVDVYHNGLVDIYGELVETRFQVLSAEEFDSGHAVRYKVIKFEFTGDFSFIMEEDAPDYADATDAEKEAGCWIAEASGLMPDGSDGYQIQ